ncbi:MAG: hypothetical protein RR235_08685, partial [Oscillospiraceae bacterium]
MIRGNKRPPEQAEKINVDIPMNIHNRFDFEVIDASTGEVKQRAQAENVICNQLWTRLFTPDTYFNYIHYGTGSGTPSAADTSLFAFSGYCTPASADDQFKTDRANGIISLRRKVQLSESAAVGVTITEVGIGYNSPASTLCTHAMLKDMNGNIISITKTATDIVNIFATIFVHYNQNGYDGGKIELAAPNTATYIGTCIYIWLLKGSTMVANGHYYYLHPHTITTGWNPYFNHPEQGSTASFDLATKKMLITGSRYSADSCNFPGGIAAIDLQESTYIWGMGYMPSITLQTGGLWYPKSHVSSEPIGTGDGTSKDFSTKFNYAQSAKIYINGVEKVTGVNVLSVPHKATNLLAGFKTIEMAFTQAGEYYQNSPYINFSDSGLTSNNYIRGILNSYT